GVIADADLQRRGTRLAARTAGDNHVLAVLAQVDAGEIRDDIRREIRTRVGDLVEELLGRGAPADDAARALQLGEARIAVAVDVGERKAEGRHAGNVL